MAGGPAVGVSIAKFYALPFPVSTITVIRVYESDGVSVCEFVVARGTHGGEFMGIPG
jgi:hypothetical protein